MEESLGCSPEFQGGGLGFGISKSIGPAEASGGDDGSSAPSAAISDESSGDDLARDLQRYAGRSLQYYVSDLLVFRSAEDLNSILERTTKEIRRAGPRDLLLISQHDDHLHVIHSCSYANRSCRCRLYRYVTGEYIKRKNEARNLISSKTTGDWIRIITYFNNDGRRITYLEMGRGARRYLLGDPHLQQGSCDGESFCGLVEIRPIEREGDVPHNISYGTALGPGGSRNGRNSRAGRRRNDEGIQKTQDFLSRYPCTPLTNCVNTVPWLEDEELKYERGNSDSFKAAISTFAAVICTWNIYDFIVMYRDINCHPLFNSNSADTAYMYYDVATSVQILIRFLKFQFGGDETLVKDFLNTIHNIFEKGIPKLNTVVAAGPPSSGKNFFFDCPRCCYLNCGLLGNPNKNNTFAFQECVGKRILLWNEPNYESSMTDTLKMLLGGDQLTVKVKYLQDQTVNRTPIIVLTNNEVNFMGDPAFADRVKIYRWQAAPFLKEYENKPHPLAYIALLEHYDII
uniref:Nonstructural protein n=1 Tax=Tarsiger cyanurus ambidensovirus TaxID=2794449 RepID=A0A8A4XEE6_9VIRU|nr:MAG: nonstructural protein [Tarsiger cyanurus ambidensovirus]